MITMIRNLLAFLVFMILTFFLAGTCNGVSVHPSKNATYVHGDICIVDVTTSLEETKILTDWCVELRSKE